VDGVSERVGGEDRRTGKETTRIEEEVMKDPTECKLFSIKGLSTLVVVLLILLLFGFFGGGYYGFHGWNGYYHGGGGIIFIIILILLLRL
jgi:hypothetical protein